MYMTDDQKSILRLVEKEVKKEVESKVEPLRKEIKQLKAEVQTLRSAHISLANGLVPCA